MMWASTVILFHGRCRYTVVRRLPNALRPIGHWPVTASNSSTVRGQRTRHRLFRQTVGSSLPGSRSRSEVMDLIGVSALVAASMPNHRRASPAAAVPPPSPTGGHIPSGCRRAARVWRRRRFRQHLKPTDKPQTLCGVQGGAMANSLLYLLRTERWDEDRILTHLRRAGTLTTQRQARKGKERNRGSRSRRDENLTDNQLSLGEGQCMPRVSERVRAARWRQGSIARPADN